MLGELKCFFYFEQDPLLDAPGRGVLQAHGSLLFKNKFSKSRIAARFPNINFKISHLQVAYLRPAELLKVRGGETIVLMQKATDLTVHTN